MDKQFPTEDIVKFISRTPLFASCSADELARVVEAAHQQRFAAGAMIIPPGKPVPGLGVVLRGKASSGVVDAASGARTVLEPLQAGSFFGEVGLLLAGGNPLSVVAEEECYTLIVAKNHVEELFRKHFEVCLAMAQRISAQFVKLSMMGMASMASQPSASPTESPGPADEPGAGKLEEGQIPWVEVSSYNLTPKLLQMIPSQVIRQHRMLPLKLTGQKLTVGMVNPRSMAAIQDLRRTLHTVDPEIVAISMDDYSQTFVRLKLDASAGKVKDQMNARNEAITYSVDKEKEDEKAQLFIGSEVIGLLDKILLEATEMGVSDIHIEPETAGVKVRYRQHGMLVDRKEYVAASYATPLVARVKVLAELDITEKRKPQDGRIMAQMGRQELNLRVSTMPVARGEKAVIRIIDSADAMRPLHQIILDPAIEKSVRATLAEPYGAIIVAGPTGSGKSSTLYSMLNERKLGRPDTSIVTVEDPVEYLLQGVTQVPVVPRFNFGFADALKGMMRQDPDVIMVGELRDSETTTIMIEAALTGHLVLTSIHGNHATAVIQRLQHLGQNPILLSQALSIVVVQRLTKRLCPNCAGEAEVAPALMANLVERKILARSGSATKLPRPVGCEACNKTGYLGRIAVQEVMNFDDTIRGALAGGASPEELVESAREHGRFNSFAQSASYLMARRMLAPNDALLLVAD